MNERVKEIYTKLFENSSFCTKENLAEEFSITTKSIENTLKKYNDDIIYDKKLKRYRFNSLLPKYIPYKVFNNIFLDNIADQFIKQDYLTITNLINSSDNIFMIETNKLSDIVKKIISFTLAINNNCVLKVEYSGTGKDMEYKYIQPNTILSNEFSYFCYVTYDKLNTKNIGESRTFKFSNMGNIEAVEYTSTGIFKQDKKGTVFGEYQVNKYVTLIFDRVSGDFFKYNGMFDNQKYEIVVGEHSENITVKMYYNNLDKEVIKTIQQWMPHISIHKEDPLKEEILLIINTNYKKLLS